MYAILIQQYLKVIYFINILILTLKIKFTKMYISLTISYINGMALIS